MSSDEGSSIQPTIGITLYNESKDAKTKSSLGISFGGAYGSRAGIKTLSVNTAFSISKIKSILMEAGEDREDCKPQYKDKLQHSSKTNLGTSWTFNAPAYSPHISLDYNAFNVYGKFTKGIELPNGLTRSKSIAGFFSRQKYKSKYRANPAYGYLNSHHANRDDAFLDFTRENDGGFQPTTPTLPVVGFTYDMYSVMGQGVGGSYRPFRSDIGTVYDPIYKSNPDDSYALEIEYGVGGLGKWGGSVGFARSNSKTKRWTDQNHAKENLKFRGSGSSKSYEPVYFKEANERSVDANAEIFDRVGGSKAIRPVINSSSKFSSQAESKWTDGETHYDMFSLQKNNREKRTQLFSYLTHGEAEMYGVQDLYSASAPYHNPNHSVPGHHIAEITTLSPDGARYIYGIPAYNWVQEEYSFALGQPRGNTEEVEYEDYGKGLIGYNESDMTWENQKGIDNYYSKNTTPAYAHSYLISSILSSDYVDADNVRGPSTGDFGNYTLFSYDVVHNYKWRTPTQAGKASYNEGLKTDYHDDKGIVIYGEKDLYYLEKIETRNYVAVLITSDRKDGKGVLNNHGGIDNAEGRGMRKLDRIDLYTKAEYAKFLNNDVSATPVKSVHFVYSYSLCPGSPNSSSDSDDANNSAGNVSQAKLTLDGIYFTYQNSNKAKYSSYTFKYNFNNNPEYNPRAYDRWGHYKPNAEGQEWEALGNEFFNSELPYTPQDPALASQYAQAWCLREIVLPSGGRIKVEFESDDYGYVQNKDVMQMFPIVATGKGDPGPSANTSVQSLTLAEAQGNDEDECNYRLYFNLVEGYDNIEDYLPENNTIFYKALVNFNKDNSDATYCEYVPGYAKVDRSKSGVDAANNVGYITLRPVQFKDNGEIRYSPIVKTALQFARMQLSDKIYGVSGPGEEAPLVDALLSIVDALASIVEMFKNQNEFLFDKGIATRIISQKSMIRLKIPSAKKYGGGVRVKRILIKDQWDGVEGRIASDDMDDIGYDYGQEYSYVNEDNTTSGVASYEPQIGGEENPWKQPICYDIERKGAPDEKFFQEEPIGEMFFPSPSIGYSRVVVKNLTRAGVTRHATGNVVHEFYTTKDFPTLVERTGVKMIHHKDAPTHIRSILKLNVRDYMTVSQGFVVELNDMNGKPKKQEVYAEGGLSPLSSVEYKYRSQDIVQGNEQFKQLINDCKVIHRDGSVDEDAQLGVYYDVMNDARESWFRSSNFELQGNLDMLPIFGISIPTVWPVKNIQTTQFRSITTTKVIQRFGILDETIAKQDGSTVSTKVLAYDADSGQDLLTETVTDYDDKIYSMVFPAYWHYREMGGAYQNIGLKDALQFDEAGKAPVPDALKYYAAGDELALSGGLKAWITNVQASFIEAVDRMGAPITGIFSTKVIRSGFRNMQMGSMASITTLSDPTEQLSSNIYKKVLQASAIEYQNTWPTSCNCMNAAEGSDESALIAASSNPFVNGTRGYWKPSKSYLHLTERTQSDQNNNTNLRDDGVFTSYNPFYKRLANGQWTKDYNNWTYTSEVTLFSPYGPELENEDALHRKSAALFGYEQTLPVAVAANAGYGEIGFESFEEPNGDPEANCKDMKFRILAQNAGMNLSNWTNEQAHTGKWSMRVEGELRRPYAPAPECPDDPCQLTMNLIGGDASNNGQRLIMIAGGLAPYTVDWQITNGQGSGTLQNTMEGVALYLSDGIYMIQVTVTDAGGVNRIQNFTIQ
jgi:hypothetical protein